MSLFSPIETYDDLDKSNRLYNGLSVCHVFKFAFFFRILHTQPQMGMEDHQNLSELS